MSIELIELGEVRPERLRTRNPMYHPQLGLLGLDLGVPTEAIGYGVGSAAFLVGAAIFPAIPVVGPFIRLGLLGAGGYLAYKTAELISEKKSEEQKKKERWQRTAPTPNVGQYTSPPPARHDYDLRTAIKEPVEGDGLAWWPFRQIKVFVEMKNWGRYPVAQYFQAQILDSDLQLEDSSKTEFKIIPAYDEASGNPGKEDVTLYVAHPGLRYRGFTRYIILNAGSDDWNMREINNTTVYLL